MTTRPEHRHLRSALEFAVEIARAAPKVRPPLVVPAGIKKFVKMSRVPSGALGQLRRVVEDDEVFRQRLGAAVTPDLVDEIGYVWLSRPEGWEARIDELVAATDARAEQADAEDALRREQKRREAAEQTAVRARAEVAALQERVAALTHEIDEVRAMATKLEEVGSEFHAELLDTRTEVRHANDRAAAAAQKLERVEAELATAVRQRGVAEVVRDEVLADRASTAADAARLAEFAAAARQLADQLAEACAPEPPVHGASADPSRSSRRRPIAVPGGVAGDSEIATEHLLRSGASILVDGYNVSMLGWPALELEAQRCALLDAAEAMTRRFGADLTVVFDGADVVGASADQRRVIRVVYSPAGVIADDVIRSEVDWLPASRGVVVVTNDAEIIRDVRSRGANTVSSQGFLAVARR